MVDIQDTLRELDEFEAAGFSEDICRECRKIQMECGISSESLLALLRKFDNQELIKEVT